MKSETRTENFITNAITKAIKVATVKRMLLRWAYGNHRYSWSGMSYRLKSKKRMAPPMMKPTMTMKSEDIHNSVYQLLMSDFAIEAYGSGFGVQVNDITTNLIHVQPTHRNLRIRFQHFELQENCNTKPLPSLIVENDQ